MATVDSPPSTASRSPRPLRSENRRGRPRRGGRQGISERPSNGPAATSMDGDPSGGGLNPESGNRRLPSADVSADGQQQRAEAAQTARSTTGGVRSRGRRNIPQVIRVGNGRQFGGHLTPYQADQADQERPLPAISNLQPDAPEFHPQHLPTSSSSDSARASITSRRKYDRSNSSKYTGTSSAADIATRTHEDIAHNVYECPICTNNIGKTSRVWSCTTCWTVFHLSCVKKWSTNEQSAQARSSQQDDSSTQRSWRCPGCNLPQHIMPTTYTCWCGKDADPRSLPGLPPHSCGQTCGKERTNPKKCSHRCELTCHAGPCPPCPHMGPTQACFCGKESITRRCVDTNYDNGWECGSVCGELMPCAEHTCQRKCHQGLCGACKVDIAARCYCGKVKKSVSCSERGKEQKSETFMDDNGQKIEHWTGSFNCGEKCRRYFDCGIHQCQRECHVQCAAATKCPRSPDSVPYCPCGKTLVAELLENPRKSCEDPIPNCGKRCLKKLPCGHECMQTCHLGNCMPCLKSVPIACRCGRVITTTMCHQGSPEPPQCMRICRARLSCGRHECGERCCLGERKAAERLSSKRKQRPLDAPAPLPSEGVEAEHICTRVCGRPLKCGNHFCSELCHKGPCGTCREAVFDEITCNCGRTVLQPPLPCGTVAPACQFDCTRHKSCGHPQLAHNCHGDGEECPKCPFLTEKICMCGKKSLKNQQCWRNDVSCGDPCGAALSCGSHACRKICHRPGNCEDVDRACQQPCGKPKRSCGHPCSETCHAPLSCREDSPCQHKILVTCQCQHLKKEMRCNASKSSQGNNRGVLDCDDECARLERNHRLALALNIDQETHQTDIIPYSKQTLDMFRNNIKWTQTQEQALRIFAADDSEKRIRFKPMPQAQRAFLHSLAEDFGFDSESLDPEPHRHVLILKTPRFVMAPMKTLSQCIEIREKARSASTTQTNSELESTGTNNVSLPFNAILLASPRFGLTVEELHADLAEMGGLRPALAFDINFLPSEDVVIRLHSPSSTTRSEREVERLLREVKPPLSEVIRQKSLASAVTLCRADTSLNILRPESEEAADSGWSKVAAKAAAPRTVVREKAMGQKSVFTVLGTKMREEAKRKRKEELLAIKQMQVVDDWEKAEEEEETKERTEREGREEREALGSGAQRLASEVDSL